jgi:hypothetical protein
MKNAGPDDHLFRIVDHADESEVHPSPYAGGPWNPEHQHGGAVSALLARSIDRLESPVPMRIARLTIEMFRGVPLTPLRVRTRVVRGGRRIQGVEASIRSGDVEVARATGLRIRRADDLPELEAGFAIDPELGGPPEQVPDLVERSAVPLIPGFARAVEIDHQAAEACGTPSNVWSRLRCRVVEGEETAPVVGLVSQVDFASGTGNAMDYARYTSINPDLTIHVIREPRSDWIGIRGITRRADDGIGQSLATAHDLEGPVAHVAASLLLDRR